ncbi:hypothetical protein BG015_011702 [Linnemannia schmuckeri]|uniref:Uncharacterized protein n=1 Tax=Linnemannia schmuckeri TaxID=64567 RepID=A0A9P5RUE3_9FUNG|nr:hypothetical protein BG015_011702 [Linnemannia schmuckeri]
METEYLDIVNKELHDIQQFFAHYYYPSRPLLSTLTNQQHALAVLPLLKPSTVIPPSSPPSSSHGTDTIHDGGDDLFDFSFLYHTYPPPPPSSCGGDGVEKDQYVADLRDRYKQLKAVQDQMHLELTRSRILKQSIQVVGVTKSDDHARLSPLQEKKGRHTESSQERTEPLPFGDSPRVMREPLISLPFNDSPAQTTATTTPTPAPKETTGAIITTTTTGTGTTTITTTMSTAATAKTANPIPVASQPRQTYPSTLKDVRRLTAMIYQFVKTFVSSYPFSTYVLLGLLLTVFLPIWPDCTNDVINRNPILNDRLPMTDHKIRRTFVPPVPEDLPRYPWPRH